MKRLRNQTGAALLETAITIPLVLLVTVSIFEFGRAYQTWQILTNAAREGARVAILADATDERIRNTVTAYLTNGKLAKPNSATITINRAKPFGTTNTASEVTVAYPFNFRVLNPVIRLVQAGSKTGQGTTTITSVALMRNES
ncbi:MAG TPA: TadE/TadG family type IV pilus assembly protein [Vicinamibacterales bacterium]|nr:TadE/TadG family type IV pilus assembly protein [Vicinamibacterales bacterium]